jgi:predicted methyltransferase
MQLAARILGVASATILLVTGLGEALASDKDRLEALANGEHRAAGAAERNRYRHPVETLNFFGLEPEMTVVELSPGGGWYTEIIAPYVAEAGRYVAAGFDLDSANDRTRASAERFKAKLDAHARLYGDDYAMVPMAPGDDWVEPGTADMVLTFRSIHGWMGRGTAEAIFADAYRALKPGGILGVVEHRARADAPPDPEARLGYVPESHAIALAEAAGFRLVEKSEINANPKDSADWEGGVWTLPPTLRHGDENRDKYLAIGESDRFTLKFIKPEQGT